mgnify:FL=1
MHIFLSGVQRPIAQESETDCPRSKMIVSLMRELNLGLLNTGEPTYLSPRTNRFSQIDISIISPQLLSSYSWYVLSNLHNSDHFPILIRLENTPNISLPIKWLYQKSD